MIENEFVDAVSGGLLQSMDIIKYCNDIQSNGIELSSVYVDLLATSLLELPGSVKRQRYRSQNKERIYQNHHKYSLLVITIKLEESTSFNISKQESPCRQSMS